MQSKLKALLTVLTVLVAVGGLTAYSLVNGKQSSQQTEATTPQPVAAETVTDGNSTQVQVITIIAKGGYSPQTSFAKANTPTVIRVSTDSTFDCSSALTIPALGWRGHLPMTGVTTIAVPPQSANSQLTGLCSMGMYSFTIKFLG